MLSSEIFFFKKIGSNKIENLLCVDTSKQQRDENFQNFQNFQNDFLFKESIGRIVSRI